MAALAGAEVAFIGAVGMDFWGDDAVANLRRHGMTADGVIRSTLHTGLAPIWVDERSGENRIIVIPGANEEVSSDFVKAALAEIDFDAIVCQLEIPQAASAAAFDVGRARGAVTVLNPAPWVALDNSLTSLADWIVPNESEFAGLLRQAGSDAYEATPAAVAQAAARLGTRLAVTLGERGVLVCSDPNSDPRRIDVPEVIPRDTTGAGDAFVGAFAYGLAAGMNPEEAAGFGCLCATDSVTRFGTQTSFRRPPFLNSEAPGVQLDARSDSSADSHPGLPKVRHPRALVRTDVIVTAPGIALCSGVGAEVRQRRVGPQRIGKYDR